MCADASRGVRLTIGMTEVARCAARAPAIVVTMMKRAPFVEEFVGKRGKALIAPLRPAWFEPIVFALDQSVFTQA